MQDFKDALVYLPPDLARMTPDEASLAEFWLWCLANRNLAPLWERKARAALMPLQQASAQAAELIGQYLD
jgi:hypothetical protein